MIPEINRPATLADLLDDPELFTSSGSRVRAKNAAHSLIWMGAHSREPGITGRWIPPSAEWADVTRDPGSITLADFARRVDRRCFWRAKDCGKKTREEFERGLAKYGYALLDDRDAAAAKPDRVPMTRDALLARVSDVLRRSGVADSDTLAREVELLAHRLEVARTLLVEIRDDSGRALTGPGVRPLARAVLQEIDE